MKILKRIAATIVIGVIFFFLVKGLVNNWSQIPFRSLRFNPLLLVLSFVILIPHFICYSKSWQEIMNGLGTPITLAQSTWMIATTQIAKYVPGRVWYLIGRVYVGRKENLDGMNLAVSMVLETCMLLITSLIITLIATIFAGRLHRYQVVVIVLLLVLSIVIMHPALLNWFMNLGLKIIKKPPARVTITYGRIIRLSVYFFGLWIAQILGFYCLVNSLLPVNIASIFRFSSAYCLSWSAGFLAILTPGGLGVREGVMTVMLSSLLTTPVAVSISFISRVWITLFEIGVFFVGLLMKQHKHAKPLPSDMT